MERIDQLYNNRFPDEDRKAKERVWKVLCEGFFQRYVKDTDTILDLACGFGEFSRYIKAGRKMAVDINPKTPEYLPKEVEFQHRLLLAQIELWKKDYEIGVYMLPKHLDEEVARLHLPKIGVKLTEMTDEQADYIGIDKNGPYKPEHYRY